MGVGPPWSGMAILGRCYRREILPWREMSNVVCQRHRRADRAEAGIQVARFRKKKKKPKNWNAQLNVNFK